MTVTPKPTDGRRRAVVERVLPEIDCGRFPAKAVIGDTVRVRADVVADGHDRVGVELLWRAEQDEEWHTAPMGDPENDRWSGSFPVTSCGRYGFTVRAWVDRFASWSSDLAKRLEGGQEDVSQELLVGAGLVQAAARRASGRDETERRAWAQRLKDVATRAARTPSATRAPSAPPPAP